MNILIGTLVILIIFLILFGLFIFYQFYNFKNYLHIYNILNKHFSNYILIKNEIKRIFKIDYTKNGEYFELFQNKIFLGDISNEKTILTGYLLFLYNQIGDKDEFFDNIYIKYGNSNLFYKIELDLLNQNGFYKNDEFYKNLYISIFFNIQNFDINTQEKLKQIYFLK